MLINQGIVLPMLGVIVYPHTWLIMFIAVVVGTLMGAISGFIITRFNVAPFIATLGMLYVARGMALLLNNGYTFPNLVGRPELGNTGFPGTGRRRFLQCQLLHLDHDRLCAGRRVCGAAHTLWPAASMPSAATSVRRSCRASRSSASSYSVYMISGFCAAVVGLIIASQLVAAHPATGQFFELNAIAAVVLGGTSCRAGAAASAARSSAPL